MYGRRGIEGEIGRKIDEKRGKVEEREEGCF